MLMPAAGGSGSFSGAPSRNANASFRSRENNSAPRDQYRRFESPDQWMYSPVSRDTVADGIVFMSGLMSIVLPVRTNGVMRARNFSVHASHFSSGEIAKSVANAEMTCVRSSPPSMSTERSARLPSSSKVMKKTRSFGAPNWGSAPFFDTSYGFPPAVVIKYITGSDVIHVL